MSSSWTININNNAEYQTKERSSFVGGKPALPKDTQIPRCKLCDSQQTFLFQIAFPDGHAWEGKSLAVFFCTSCADENHLIPEMLETDLHGADIPEGFLDSYQRNFRFIVFETANGVLCLDYEDRVRYKPIGLQPTPTSSVEKNKVGGSPVWLLEDESPGSYAGSDGVCFLLQIAQDMKFDINDSAPPQMELGLMGDPEPASHRHYQFFNGNNVYLFGVKDKPLVYAITQI